MNVTSPGLGLCSGPSVLDGATAGEAESEQLGYGLQPAGGVLVAVRLRHDGVRVSSQVRTMAEAESPGTGSGSSAA